MAIQDYKVSETYSGRDISSLPDKPNQAGMSATELKARFDQLSKEVIPQYNDLIDFISGALFGGVENTDHIHDTRYYTETELDAGQLDDRYYTETEVNDLLATNSTNDRSRANHTGTQLASTISDFDSEVSNNTDVSNNTSARHIHANKTILDNTTASFTSADETKLDGIQSGAEVNQNAFSNIKVGGSTGNADSKTATFEIVAGSNIIASIDPLTNKVTLSATGDISTLAVQSILDDIGNYYNSLEVNGALQEIGLSLLNKVDKVTGKGLSTNDYTTVEKNKVSNLPDDTNAQLADKPTQTLVLNKPEKVKFVAHRGFSQIAPENSIPAFELAGSAGFWGVECDVLRTSDGHWIVMHDKNIDRMTNGTGNVKDLTLAQIKSFVFDTGNNVSYYPNLKVPTLEELLTVCRSYNVVPIIEIKAYPDLNTPNMADDIPNLLEVIRAAGFEEKCSLISFDFLTLVEIRKHSKKIPLQYLGTISTGALDQVYLLGNIAVNESYTTLTKEKIDLAHSYGLQVNCYTLNDYAIAKTLIGYGIDMISTDKIVEVR